MDEILEVLRPFHEFALAREKAWAKINRDSAHFGRKDLQGTLKISDFERLSALYKKLLADAHHLH